MYFSSLRTGIFADKLKIAGVFIELIEWYMRLSPNLTTSTNIKNLDKRLIKTIEYMLKLT